MPEENKRVVVKGIKAAQAEFEKYVRLRLAAEKSTAQLEAELKKTLAEVERVARESAHG